MLDWQISACNSATGFSTWGYCNQPSGCTCTVTGMWTADDIENLEGNPWGNQWFNQYYCNCYPNMSNLGGTIDCCMGGGGSAQGPGHGSGTGGRGGFGGRRTGGRIKKGRR